MSGRTVAIVLTLLLAMAVPLQANHGDGTESHDTCDFNKDGRVSEEEKQQCSDGTGCQTGCDDTGDQCQTGCDGAGDQCKTGCDGNGSQPNDSNQETMRENCDTNGNGVADNKEWYEQGCGTWGQDPDKPCDFDRDGRESDAERADPDCEGTGGDSPDQAQLAAKCDANGNGIADNEEWLDEGCGTWGQDPDKPCDFDRDGRESDAERKDPDCAGDGYGDDEQSTVDEEKARQERQTAIEEAEQEGRVGGSFKVSSGDDTNTETKDGVKVRIAAQTPTLTEPRAAVKITLDANLDEGKTFVFDVDSSLLGTDAIKVRYFSVDEQSGNETEETITEASDLTDILNPNNDNGPEYWVVTDSDGVHAMVSIPAWSVHAIALEADSRAGDFGGVQIPAPALPATALALLGAAAIAVRRKQSDA